MCGDGVVVVLMFFVLVIVVLEVVGFWQVSLASD